MHLYILITSLLTTLSCQTQSKPTQETSTLETKVENVQIEKKKRGDKTATAAFAEGCFWCGEHIFESIPGIDSVISGYAGGFTLNPTYEEVGGEKTGHAETVMIYYDPDQISFSELVNIFFSSHDPTTFERQGPDAGNSYRSVAFYQTDEEKKIIEKFIADLSAKKIYKNKIVTEVKKLDKFYRAEEYHQNYIEHHPENPYVQSVSIPRYEAFIKNYIPLKKEEAASVKYTLNDTVLTKVVKTADEWKKVLNENQFYILREQGTERPFQNEYWDNHKEGIYFCAACGLPLFSSKSKFESGTGWPSFFAPLNKNRIKEVIDRSHGMVRGEIVCARCEGHLGHVFDDGPKPTGLRYCMNSGAMMFR